MTLIRLNRPQALNALNGQLMDDLTAALGACLVGPNYRRPTRADDDTVFVAGVMEHIEEAGVHSGDSALFAPAVLIAA